MKMIKVNAGDKLVLSGADEMFASAMVSGVDGAIGSSYNYAPELFIKMREVFGSDIKEFMRLSEASIKIVSAFINHSFLPSMKASLELLGLGTRILRSPKASVSEKELSALKKDLREIKAEYKLDFVELFDLI